VNVRVTIKHDKQINLADQAGFTLLETSIAMVLLAIVGLGIASCFFFAAQNNSSARDRELAMTVAQQQMEQYRNLPFNNAGLAATASSGTSAVITRSGRRYQVLTTITDSNMQNGTARTKTIQIRVVPLSDNSLWARNIATVFGAVTIIAERTSQTLGPNRAI
jgi:prepilin-type N-terminal cleavage/methylation domain-containing protein